MFLTNLARFRSLALRSLASVFLTCLALIGTIRPAWAWDIWLVTNQRRILKIQDVEGVPVQVEILTHDPVPGAYGQQLGAIAFAPNGALYGVSLTLGTPSALYTLNLTDGRLTWVGDFPFQWGNALYFDWKSGRAYTGGGLESWRPYRLLNGFYTFDNYDPATTFLWHDMRPDYPSGGYTGGFASLGETLYATWGQGHMYNHHTYLLEITLDSQGNFVSYTNLGEAETQGASEGLWALISDGHHHLYGISPTALYRINLDSGTPTYTRILDFTLHPDEVVNHAAVQQTDLEISVEAERTVLTLGSLLRLTIHLSNHGPFDADRVRAQIDLPSGLSLQQVTHDLGSYDPQTGIWDIPLLPTGEQAALEINATLSAPGALTVNAQIVAAGPLDPDSDPNAGFNTDDYADDLLDDDEASLTLLGNFPLPDSGFPQSAGAISTFPLHPTSRADPQRYSQTQLMLEIPSLGVQAPIVGVPLGETRWDIAWLGQSVGWLQGSAFPTRPGNTVLTGHVWNADNTPGVFYHLRDLRFDDLLYLHAGGTTYVYAVRENRIISPTQTNAVFQHFEKDWLTLVTCEGYQPQEKTYRYRRMVRAVLVAKYATP